jgi:AraC-like DNA-binding protein
MDLSPNTVCVVLAEERASFRQILDEGRGDFARALLRDRSLSIGDIAFFPQDSEPAVFHRSFRQWTGRTPRAFREA